VMAGIWHGSLRSTWSWSRTKAAKRS
jgi:hypothetical protein